ncbi:hypothetical protein FACS189449_00150 [Alphaproteobacteria bacterium]|nr:hypothetical protein FACS189449_00150 [Alphaproteobacteria bacterium]
MVYKLNEERMFCDITDGIAIIIDSETGIYYSISAFGIMVFEKIIDGYSDTNIAIALVNIPNIPSDIEDKFKQFTNELLGEEIIIKAKDGENIGEVILDATVIAEGDFELKISSYSDVQEMLIADPIHDVGPEGWSPTLMEA